MVEKYERELAVSREIFGEVFETAGGKGHRFFHQVRVANYCEKFADKFGIEGERKEILVLAGLFHDIGKTSRITEDGVLDGSQKADEKLGSHVSKELVYKELCKYLGLIRDNKILEAIADIISSKESTESKILCDADNLDELGFVNIWKMFTYAGACKVSLENSISYYFTEDRPRLLKKSEEVLYFDYSKLLARERISKVDDVLNALINESRGGDILT